MDKTNQPKQTCIDYKESVRNSLKVPGNPLGLTWEDTDLYIKEYCIVKLNLPENVTMKTCYKQVYRKIKDLKEYLTKHYPYHFKFTS